jgi:branched-chain amino acid transport system substrate-binding protein
MKKMGATKVAALAYGISASSTAAAENFMKFSVPSAGLKAVYTNTTVDFGSTDVGPEVLGIKNAGADAVYLPLVANSNLAVVQGLAQNGVKMKATVLATGYGQPLLDQPVSATFGPEVIMATGYAPVELKTKATKQFQADLKKYADYTGVPDYGIYTGYITCDMAIVALQNAGNPPTRAAFVPNMRKLKTYDQAGLACRPIDVSVETYGKASPTACGWYVQVKNGKFVTFPANGKPVEGKLIGESTVATTTTAAPAQ